MLDGEIVVFDENGRAIVQHTAKFCIIEGRLLLRFDLLTLSGKDVREFKLCGEELGVRQVLSGPVSMRQSPALAQSCHQFSLVAEAD